jgi:PTH1 family peptidyl-tRNA hydrolase
VGTLHNVGADALEMVAHRAGATLRAEKGVQARVALVTLGARKVALAVPTTYMNESGLAVRKLATRFGIAEPASIVVVHDELDLPPGSVRVKAGGGLAGHNGLRSLESHLHSTDFVRVRIGVGKPPSARQGAAHVLNRPPWRRQRRRSSASPATGSKAPCSGATLSPEGPRKRAGSVDRVTSAIDASRCHRREPVLR